MRCKASELKKIMAPAINVATGRAQVVPVLMGVMLSYDGEEEVICTASDTSVFIESRGLLKPELIRDERIDAVVYSDFFKIVEMLGEKDITVTQSAKKIHIRAEDEEYSFSYVDVKEFVDMRPPEGPMLFEFTIPSGEISKILSSVLYSAQTKEHFGNACMIEFKPNDNGTYCSTTKEISIAIYPLDVELGGDSFLMPPDYLSLVGKGMRQGDVTVTLYSHSIKLETESFVFWGPRASNDKFPDVLSVVANKTVEAGIVLMRADMLRAIEKLYVIRPKYAPPVYMAIDGGEFYLGLEQTDSGSAAQIKLVADCQGDGLRYRFNLLYLRDAFQSLSSDEVKINLVRLGDGVKCMMVEDGDERNVRLLSALRDGAPQDDEGDDEV